MQPRGRSSDAPYQASAPHVVAARSVPVLGVYTLVFGALLVVHNVWVLPVLPIHIGSLFDPLRMMMTTAGMLMMICGAGLLLENLIGAGMARAWRYGRTRALSRRNDGAC